MGFSLLNNTTFSKVNAGIFLFYLALLGNYTGDLIPPDLSKFINNHRLVQHCISFFILLFTINLYTDNIHFTKIFGYTFILWVWYLLTSKQHLLTSLIIIALLLLSYISFNLSKDLDITSEEELPAPEKIDLKEKYNKFQNLCFITIFIVSIIGGTSYFIEHYKEYGKDSKTFIEFLIKYLFLGKGKRAGTFKE